VETGCETRKLLDIFVKRGVPMSFARWAHFSFWVTCSSIGHCRACQEVRGCMDEAGGCVHVITPTEPAADRVKKPMSVLQRSEISKPAFHTVHAS